MLLKLNANISNCLERAANAERCALEAADAARRCDNEKLAQSWRHLALSYQFVESLERFLSETDPRKKALDPSETPAVVEEKPAAVLDRPNWTENVVCPSCGKIGRAALSETSEEFVHRFDSVPDGFEVVDRPHGRNLYCGSCHVPAMP